MRFGSAELYDVCETVAICEEVIAIGQKIDNGSDERVILFVKTPPGKELNAEGIKAIKAAISLALSPRHVPAIILACPTIPYTVNGKKLEVSFLFSTSFVSFPITTRN